MKLTRRNLLKSSLALAAVPAANAAGIVTMSGPRLRVDAPSDQSLLQASDVSYLGYYALNDSSVYSFGFYARRVAGDLRFGIKQFGGGDNIGPIYEWDASSKNFGDTITSADRVNEWATDDLDKANDRHQHLAWDWDEDRLWYVQSMDYPQGIGYQIPSNIQIFDLPEGDPAIVDPKKISLESKTDRKTHSGMVAIPAAAQTAYGIGPYLVGLGGYNSVVTQQGGASMGPALYAIPDPTSYFAGSPSVPYDQEDSGALIDADDYHILAEYPPDGVRGVRGWYDYDFTATGTNNDYLLNSPYNDGMGGPVPAGTFDAVRGDGLYGPVNFYDAGDPRQNPGSGANPGVAIPPDFEPFDGGYQDPIAWRESEAFPWCWGDRYIAGFWIHTETRKYLALVAGVSSGKMYYASSAGYSELGHCEIHVYDPVELMQVKNGTRDPDAITPVYIWPLVDTMDGFGGFTYSKFYAAYDPTVQGDGKTRLYICAHRGAVGPGDERDFHIHTYAVNE